MAKKHLHEIKVTIGKEQRTYTMELGRGAASEANIVTAGIIHDFVKGAIERVRSGEKLKLTIVVYCKTEQTEIVRLENYKLVPYTLWSLEKATRNNLNFLVASTWAKKKPGHATGLAHLWSVVS